MVRKDSVGGIEVVFEARPVGGLGWTWSYYPERGPGGQNRGRLLSTEEEAYAAAKAAAEDELGSGRD